MKGERDPVTHGHVNDAKQDFVNSGYVSLTRLGQKLNCTKRRSKLPTKS